MNKKSNHNNLLEAPAFIEELPTDFPDEQRTELATNSEPCEFYGDVPGLERLSAEQFAAAREALGFSKVRMSAALGVRVDTVRRWESGRMSIPYAIECELQEVAESQLAALKNFFGLDG